jgi:hypothetical protein
MGDRRRCPHGKLQKNEPNQGGGGGSIDSGAPPCDRCCRTRNHRPDDEDEDDEDRIICCRCVVGPSPGAERGSPVPAVIGIFHAIISWFFFFFFDSCRFAPVVAATVVSFRWVRIPAATTEPDGDAAMMKLKLLLKPMTTTKASSLPSMATKSFVVVSTFHECWVVCPSSSSSKQPETTQR